MVQMIRRPQIVADCSPELLDKIKKLSKDKGYRTWKEFVLMSIAKSNPEVYTDILKDLGYDNLKDRL